MKKNGILSRLFGRENAPMQPPIGAMLAAIVNRPMLMAPRALDAMLASAMSMPAPEAFRDDDDWSPHGSKPEHLIDINGDVGVLTIEGPLFHRWSVEAWWWGGNGYDMIVAAHRMLVADDRVKSIVHVYDSGGGQCSGCFDAVDAISATRGQKPITAVISDDAYSAAYALASAADKIIISRTGGAGSIGVRATHVDVTGWDAAVGLKYTIVVDGEKKADYDIHTPLSGDAQAELQAEVSRLGLIFRETVAANRGLDADAIQAQQAGCFYGEGAIAAGLADEMGTLESVMAAITTPESESDNPPAPAEDEPAAPDAAEPTGSLEMSAEITGNGEGIALPPIVDALVSTETSETAEMEPTESELVAAFAAAVTASNLPPELSLALLKRGHLDQSPDEAIGYSQTIRDLCFAAGIESVAADYIKSNTPIETARAQLIAAKAEDGPEIVTALSHKTTGNGASSHSEIYSRRRAAAAGTGVSKRQ
jgi:ClpP class serine protease